MWPLKSWESKISCISRMISWIGLVLYADSNAINFSNLFFPSLILNTRGPFQFYLLLCKVDDRKLKEINTKNCIYYYLNNLININDLDFEKTIWNKKSYKDIFIYYFRYKIPNSEKPFYIAFHKIYWYIKGFQRRTEYLTLIPYKKDKI